MLCPVLHPPYQTSEQGTNKSATSMAYRFFLKRADFSLISDEQVGAVQCWMNVTHTKYREVPPPQRCSPSCRTLPNLPYSVQTSLGSFVMGLGQIVNESPVFLVCPLANRLIIGRQSRVVDGILPAIC